MRTGRMAVRIVMVGVVALAPVAEGEAQETTAPAATVTTITDTLPSGVGGVTVDRSGTVYVADFGDRVYKVKPWGETTVLTSGMYGSSGNAVDSRGNLLQANFNGNFIARVSRTGEVSIVADGLRGPVGIAVDAGDNMFVCNCSANTLSRVTPDGQVSEFATSDLLNCPNGITFGPDSALYVVNFSDGRLLKVTSEGEVSEHAVVPGGGNGHVVFAGGSLYVAGFRSNKLYSVTLDGAVREFAGTGSFGAADGEASVATFATPNGIATNPQGTVLYVNDYLTPFPQRGQTKPASVLRRIQLPTLTAYFLTALQAAGIDAAVAAYRDFKANHATFTELETNALGYRLLQQGQVQEAIRVFQLNTEDYPGSWNVWDSLGEGYKVAGDREKAIENYRKSMELNPRNTNGISMLRELGVEWDG